MWYLLLYSKKPAESLWPHHGKPHSVSSVPVHSDSSRLVFGLVWECLLLWSCVVYRGFLAGFQDSTPIVVNFPIPKWCLV